MQRLRREQEIDLRQRPHALGGMACAGVCCAGLDECRGSRDAGSDAAEPPVTAAALDHIEPRAACAATVTSF